MSRDGHIDSKAASGAAAFLPVCYVHLQQTACESYNMAQISRNWADLVKRARAKQLAPDEFMSGTFTISDLGNFGADIFDAILPPGGTPNLVQSTTRVSLCCTSRPPHENLATTGGQVWLVSIIKRGP